MMTETRKTEAELKGDSAISLFKSTTTNALSVPLDRQAYEDRLLSFKPTTYYAKPACLSPIVCARFGWRNAEKDMLSCATCNEAIFVYLNHSLSAKSMEKVCSMYRQQLATAHSPDCPFHLSTAQFARLDGAAEATTVPPLAVAVLSQACVELMEHPLPSSVLRPRVESLKNACRLADPACIQWRFPQLELPKEVLEFGVEEKKGEGLFSGAMDLLEADDMSTVILATMGWVVIEDGATLTTNETSVAPTVSLGCPVCLSIMELTLRKSMESASEQEGAQVEAEPPEKRRRKLAMYCNPHGAHRHYCPYVCGFPRTVSANEQPLWQLILKRLHFEEGVETDQAMCTRDNASFERIRQVLRMAIVPKKVDLSEELDDDVAELV